MRVIRYLDGEDAPPPHTGAQLEQGLNKGACHECDVDTLMKRTIRAPAQGPGRPWALLHWLRSRTVTLHISADLVAQIVAHARRDHPDEACGVIAGPAGSDRPTRLIPMVNAARSPTFYEFDSQDLLRLYREMDDRDEEPVVIYHSHTATEAYPSRTDIGLASEPAAHYVLISTRETGPEDGPYELRSFRITDGVVTEEEVVLTGVESSAPPTR